MADIETLGILEEIQTLVYDKLQVVTYKWLSRNFLVSSNAAKRLLQDFVKKYETGLEVVYGLSGWLKNNPSRYHIRLVAKSNLEEAKLEFDENCSIQVYSVQACIPKDPATLWNAEFVQAEELFKQPVTVDNCLRDNRFCGVSNSSVQRNAGSSPVNGNAAPVKTEVSGLPKSNSAQKTATVAQPQRPNPASGPQTSNVPKDVKSDGYARDTKSTSGKDKFPQMPTNKKKGQSDRNSSGSSGALANMWGRASAKPKPETTSTETKSVAHNSTGSAEAQICAREALEYGSSDDDGQQVNVKRTSNNGGSRKRRVVFDMSDEEDEYVDAVSLASPDLPSTKSAPSSKLDTIPKVEKNNLNFEDEMEDKPEVKEVKQSKSRSNNLNSIEEHSTANNGKTAETSFGNIPENGDDIKDKVNETAPKSPKRRKVLKKRIDERGREVTEVVWEGEETETKPETDTTKKTNNAVKNAFNRAPETKKSPAMGSNAPSNQGGRGAGGKKAAGVKDPKQGNIMSFFKKKVG